MDQWVTYAEAARATRVLTGTLVVWAHRGKVRTTKIGGRTHVHLGDVRRAERAWRERVARV